MTAKQYVISLHPKANCEKFTDLHRGPGWFIRLDKKGKIFTWNNNGEHDAWRSARIKLTT